MGISQARHQNMLTSQAQARNKVKIRLDFKRWEQARDIRHGKKQKISRYGKKQKTSRHGKTPAIKHG